MSGVGVHWEVLPPAQRDLWPLLSGTADLGFVLYGGTAVALRLGHRSSIDFDFFSEAALDKIALAHELTFLSHSVVIQDLKDTHSVLVPAGAGSVKVSFFGEIEIGRAGTPDRTPDGIVEIASLVDLLATKLKVIQQRIEAKDYQDIIAILTAGVSLEEGLAAATVMFSPNFQPSEALKALGYFEGGDLSILSGKQKHLLTTAISKVRRIPAGAILSRTLSSSSRA